MPLPLRRSVSIATSTAQQDAGVYELSFRDERYMPFEGAGALSSCRLSLPQTFRPFDYRTVNDVILHVTYTAEADELLRERVEQRNAELEGTLRNVLATSGLTRVFSIRNDFSGAFQRLLHQPEGTPVQVRIGSEHFPLFLQGIELRATGARVALAAGDGALGGFRLAVDGHELSSFSADAQLGGLPAQNAGAAFVPDVVGDHVFAVVEAGSLGVADPVPGDLSAVDADKLNDVLLCVDYAPA